MGLNLDKLNNKELDEIIGFLGNHNKALKKIIKLQGENEQLRQQYIETLQELVNTRKNLNKLLKDYNQLLTIIR